MAQIVDSPPNNPTFERIIERTSSQNSVAKQPTTIESLPIEVLSHTFSLLPPAFYPSGHESHQPAPSHPLQPSPDTLDPQSATKESAVARQTLHSVVQVNRAFRDAARPWLWEDVDVYGGRGWLSVVQGLVEEVGGEEVQREQEVLYADAQAWTEANAVAAANTSPVQYQGDAGSVPMEIDNSTISSTSSVYSNATTPNITPGSSYQPRRSSPPRLASLSALGRLVTPPGSRQTSPVRLRGRSKSPHGPRVGFAEGVGIEDVLMQSRLTPGLGLGSIGSSGGILRKSSLRNGAFRRQPSSDGSTERSDSLDFREPLPPTTHLYDTSELPEPGPYIRHLSFSNFRTIGSGRTHEEAVRGRFVTGGRLEGVIKNAPNLITLCMTEYVDSALTYSVIEELFFRGTRRPPLGGKLGTLSVTSPQSMSPVRSGMMSPLDGADPNSPDALAPPNQLDPPRPDYAPYESETAEELWDRRRAFAPMRALDFTACVSRAFTEGMQDFVGNWLTDDPVDGEDDEERRGRGRSRGRRKSRRNLVDLHSGADTGTSTEESGEDSAAEEYGMLRKPKTSTFPALRRLSLRGCTTLPAQTIQGLVLSLTNLTHLDLSATRVPSSLLTALTERPPARMRLVAVSFAKCTRMEGSALVDFLCHSPVTRDLHDLNLFGDATFPIPLSEEELETILKTAPAFKTGKLRYLDLSSAPLTPRLLSSAVFPPQPCLVSLGLSHIPNLSLRPIADFLIAQAPRVEVLTLTNTALLHELKADMKPLQTTLTLHQHLINPCTQPPFSIQGLTPAADLDPAEEDRKRKGPTNLRVVELSTIVRRALGPGLASPEWKVVKSKGGRGWYVDISAGWVWRPVPEHLQTPQSEEFQKIFERHLPASDPSRMWLTKLASADGRVGSGVGWHARKMEVIKGDGMMGREEGLGGAGAFAYDG